MKARLDLGAFFTASVVGMTMPVAAQVARPPGASNAVEQQEADYRVIAARCGTPSFERSFYKQSMAAVAAGLVVKNRDPAQVEKTITSLRRSPFVLVTASADCAGQLVQLTELQKARAGMLGGKRGRAQTR